MARLRSRKSPVEEFAAEVESRLAHNDSVAVTNSDRALLDLTAATPGWVPLGRLLVERADVSDDQVTGALATQSATGRRLGEILLEEGVISEHSLADMLAAQFGLGTVELQRTKLERDTVELLSA